MKKVFSAAMAAALSMGMIFNSLAATKLPAPVNVQWSPDQEALPQWSRVEGAAGEYQVEGYMGNDRFYNVHHTFPITNMDETLSAGGFLNNLEKSGIYNFRVKALGDGNNTEDSDWSDFSENWSFTKADITFGVPSNLHWDGTAICWDAPEIPTEYQDYFYGYEVSVYADGELYVTHDAVRETSYDQAKWMDREGVEEYTFALRMISNTPSKIFHGEQVKCTEAFHVGNVNTDISGKLDGIMNGGGDAIISAPDTLSADIKNLQVSMQSDEAVLQQVKELEEAYASQKNIGLEINAADDVEIDSNSVSIVGAVLNAAGENNVVFNISKPAKDSVVDETAYKNCVQFDFKLKNAVGTLKVPVRITVPIPETINPRFFRILHDHGDGKPVEIDPLTVKIDDTVTPALASFTVTSFSTFIFAEAGADFEKIATPSNAEEFLDLAKSLPDSMDGLSEDEVEDIKTALGKLMAALKDKTINTSIRNKFLESEKKEGFLKNMSSLLDSLGGSDISITKDSGIDEILYVSVASGFFGAEQAPSSIHFNYAATSSNAREKLVFNISMTVDGEETTELISPLKFYLEVPDGYTYNKNDKITVSDGKAKAASGGKVKLSYDEARDCLVVFTTQLGTFKITGSSSGGSSSVSSGGNSKTTSTPHLPPRSPAGGRWEKDGNHYRYYYSDGMLASNCWLEITWNNTTHWYHFNASGIMDTGWLKDNFGNWYYLNVSADKVYGSMVTGWNLIDGNWYYFNEKSDGFKGTLLTDIITPDGYKVNADGVWVQ
ncbi:hypothetical protein AALB64_08350 [Lachnospiraceae bacterium 45-P1]